MITILICVDMVFFKPKPAIFYPNTENRADMGAVYR